MPQPTPQYEHAVRVTVPESRTTMVSWWAGTVPVRFRRCYRDENSYSRLDIHHREV
jgi:hypothetical protein